MKLTLITLLLILTTAHAFRGIPVPFNPDVKQDEIYTIDAENVVYLGHTTKSWDFGAKTEKAVKELVKQGRKAKYQVISMFNPNLSREKEFLDMNYIKYDQIDLVVASQGGDHELRFPNLKKIFIVGGNTGVCLCHGFRDIFDGIEEAGNHYPVDVYIVRDGIYNDFPFHKFADVKESLDYISLFMQNSFVCPRDDYRLKRRNRFIFSHRSMNMYFDEKFIKTIDLEPNDDISVEEATSTFNLRIISSKDLAQYMN